MKKLNETNREELLAFLGQDPYVNLFLIGDLELFGFDDYMQSYYGEEVDGKLAAVIFRFGVDSLHLYAEQVTSAYIDKVKELLAEAPYTNLMVGGKTMELIGDLLDEVIKSKDKTTLSAYYPNEVEINTVEKIEKLTTADIDAIAAVHLDAFPNSAFDVERTLKQLETDATVIYGIKKDNNVVSVASYTARTDDSAMIIGVGTLEQYRNRGYASQIVKKMCDDLLADSTRAVLFYDNPVAAKIYEKIGFTPVSDYYMNKLK